MNNMAVLAYLAFIVITVGFGRLADYLIGQGGTADPLVGRLTIGWVTNQMIGL